METKINIAAILKDKPQGTKLYDWLHNIDVELDTISTTDTETVVWCTNETNNNTTCHRGYSEFGTERGYPDGLRILFPSKGMRDWSKFTWKKGDVLYSAGLKEYCVFNKFISDGYLMFISNYNVDENTKRVVPKTYDPDKNTVNYEKVSDEKATEIISLIEEHYGGKLNLSTLEIEKQQLFEALAKESKQWDAGKKMIIDLKPKVELKPFDNVLVRHQKTEEWRANIFSHTDKTDEYLDYVCVNGRWEFCIPYEGNESLLGTTKDVEG